MLFQAVLNDVAQFRNRRIQIMMVSHEHTSLETKLLSEL
jgi:hypothetical protein